MMAPIQYNRDNITKYIYIENACIGRLFGFEFVFFRLCISSIFHILLAFVVDVLMYNKRYLIFRWFIHIFLSICYNIFNASYFFFLHRSHFMYDRLWSNDRK